jgi:hypothetical protein
LLAKYSLVPDGEKYGIASVAPAVWAVYEMHVLLVDELETLHTCCPLPQSATKVSAPLPPLKLAIAGPAPTTADSPLTRSTTPPTMALRASPTVTPRPFDVDERLSENRELKMNDWGRRRK